MPESDRRTGANPRVLVLLLVVLGSCAEGPPAGEPLFEGGVRELSGGGGADGELLRGAPLGAELSVDGRIPPGGEEGVRVLTVQQRSFSPSRIEVHPGETLVWEWASGAGAHNLTWVSSPIEDIPMLRSGRVARVMPSIPGSYLYYCTLHGTPHEGMRGTIEVAAPAP